MGELVEAALDAEVGREREREDDRLRRHVAAGVVADQQHRSRLRARCRGCGPRRGTRASRSATRAAGSRGCSRDRGRRGRRCRRLLRATCATRPDEPCRRRLARARPRRPVARPTPLGEAVERHAVGDLGGAAVRSSRRRRRSSDLRAPCRASVMRRFYGRRSCRRRRATRTARIRMRGCEIRIKDTLSGEVRPLEPRQAGRAGHLRLRADGLRRDPRRQRAPLRRLHAAAAACSRHLGYEPTVVINLTDVNDKIYDAARGARACRRTEHAEEMTAATSTTPTSSGSAGPTTSRARRRRCPRSSR